MKALEGISICIFDCFSKRLSTNKLFSAGRSAQTFLLSLATIFMTFPASGQDVDTKTWTVNQIISATAAREAVLEGLDVVVSVDSPILEDLGDYNEALESYNRAVAQFYRLDYEASPPHGPFVQTPTKYFRYRWYNDAGVRIDMLDDASRDSVPDSSICYDGRVWHNFTSAEWLGPDVIIDQNVAAPAIAEYLGVGGRLDRIVDGNYDHEDSVPRPLSTALSLLAHGGGNLSISLAPKGEGDDRVVSLTVMTPHKGKPGKEYAYDVYYETVMKFSPELAMAPTFLSMRTMVRSGDSFTQSPQGSQVSVNWSDFRTLDNGQYIAQKSIVTRRATIMLPATNEGFKPLIRDGSPLLVNGEKSADIFDAEVRSFVLEEREVLFSSIRLSQDAAGLCEAVLPAGSVVEDRIAAQSYQLVADGSPTDDLLRKKLIGEDRFVEPLQVQKSNPRSTFWILANVVIVMILVAVLVFNFLQKRRSRLL